MKTIENNALIAIFMGGVRLRHLISLRKAENASFPNGFSVCHVDYLQYDTSWDWIMPVVEKIERLNLGTINLDEDDTFQNANAIFRIEYKDVYVDLFGDMKKEDSWMQETESNTKIEATYKAVVKFIKWYNQNK